MKKILLSKMTYWQLEGKNIKNNKKYTLLMNKKLKKYTKCPNSKKKLKEIEY